MLTRKFIPISVVIPCYRCSMTIRRSVDSIFAQSAIPFEIILVDDCSEDTTLDVLHELKNIHLGKIVVVALLVNSGAATARNAGWSIATQPYIAFLDSDDTWHPDKLRIQYGYMRANNNVYLSGHQCVLFQKNINKKKVLETPVVTCVSAYSLLFKNSFSTPTVMLKRNIPLRFQAGKRCAEDILLWQEMAFLGLKVVRIEIILAYVHKPLYGASGLSAQLWEMEKGELSNFVALREGGGISFLLLVIATLFSLAKFIKRFIIVKIFGFSKKYNNESEFI